MSRLGWARTMRTATVRLCFGEAYASQMISFGPLRRRAPAALAALVLAVSATAARAASVYTVTVTTNVDLGTITASATGDTVFRADPNTGAITTVSGTATRSGAATGRAQVTIHCAGTAGVDCIKTVNVKIGPVGSASGRARTLSRLLFAMGTATLAGSPGAPASGTFTISPIGANASKTFFVGADFTVGGDDSGLATGNAESDFFAWAAESPGAPTTGDVGRYAAKVVRSIAMAKTADLVFGAVARPAAGSGSVTIDAATGARAVAGGVVALPSPSPGAAGFKVTGEGGQAITVTVPGSFVMNGPAAITVTTTSTVAGAPILSAALGSAGSYAFGVGGSAPITSTTPTGDYTGAFTVTVAYN